MEKTRKKFGESPKTVHISLASSLFSCHSYNKGCKFVAGQVGKEVEKEGKQ